jgi:two-component system, NtrC family, response regulator AtoC
LNRTLLIVDDEPTIRSSLCYYFQSRNFSVHDASSGETGITMSERLQPDVVLMDYKLPDMTGVEAISRVNSVSPDSVLIIMTAFGSISGAVDAVRSGAFDYLAKPVDLEKLEMTIERALELARLKNENRFLRKVSSSIKGSDIIGSSPQVHKLILMVNLLAENADTTVLIEGESGTGKEVVARAIHEKSRRSDKPFIEINCATLSENLLESELFGHERGAFTDAKDMKRGLLEMAEGGTLFLDEIGEMSLSLQPKLLRMLETQSFRRVGGTRDIGFNVRFIAATNKNLTDSVRDKTFREDLYYRLRVMPLTVPPLRERGNDVLQLARYFITRMDVGGRHRVSALDPRCEKYLTSYYWPGNVRELKNVLERAVILSTGQYITPEHLPRELTEKTPGGRSENEAAQTLEEVETAHILSVMKLAKNNQSEAARILGISRSTLIARLKKSGSL